jgi:hypothetical protein
MRATVCSIITEAFHAAYEPMLSVEQFLVFGWVIGPDISLIRGFSHASSKYASESAQEE